MAEAAKENPKAVVVVAVDGEHHCMSAFVKAVESFPKDSTFYHIVHVRVLPAVDVIPGIAALDEDRLAKESKDILKKFADLAEEAGIKYSVEELKASPYVSIKSRTGEALTEYCQAVKADTLVMGCHGIGPFARLLQPSHWKPSASEFCKHHACCPVFTESDLAVVAKPPVLNEAELS